MGSSVGFGVSVGSGVFVGVLVDFGVFVAVGEGVLVRFGVFDAVGLGVAAGSVGVGYPPEESSVVVGVVVGDGVVAGEELEVGVAVGSDVRVDC